MIYLYCLKVIKMKKKQKMILGIAGVISTLLGILFSVPGFLQGKYILAAIAMVFVIGGIILLAIAVNMIELVCSAGLPAVYTQILALSNLPTWQYYSYIFLYILIFMLDDFIVFIIAMFTLKISGLSNKYAHVSNLIGGVLMILIGLLLILRPEWLMFN